MSNYGPNLAQAISQSIAELRGWGKNVDAGAWQGVKTQGKPDLLTKEVLNLGFSAPMPATREEAVAHCEPNLPWAETEHLERVGGVPRNPHASLEQWPWWRGQTEATMYEGMFSHTYSERFWPKHVSEFYNSSGSVVDTAIGLRYNYGDLSDVVNLLRREPQGRQAYLPIFFPEDTGAVHGGRVPCTLGYHFMLRDKRLHTWYDIRSCDAVRHFRDDIYLAVRLTQHVLAELQEDHDNEFNLLWNQIKPGDLHFCAHSFHVHMGDYHKLA